MKELNSLPFPDDIIERILTFSPSFSSLRSAILTAKPLYTVFKAHPKSIIRAVAYNTVGPALPQALRLVRYRLPDSDDFNSEERDENLDPDVEKRQKHETDESAFLMLKEITQIVNDEKIVRELEDLWSFRYKDRSSRQSTLSPVESCHFRRAVYRIMLYVRVFSVRKYLLAYNSRTGTFGPFNLQEERLKRISFLSEFTTEELYRIHCIVIYLREVIAYIEERFSLDTFEVQTGPLKKLACSLGPAFVLNMYKTEYESFYHAIGYYRTDNASMYDGYLYYPISKIIEERKEEPFYENFADWHYISADLRRRNDGCDRCPRLAGFGIYCRDSWVEQTQNNLSEILLKSNLRFNIVEIDFVRTQLDLSLLLDLEQPWQQDPSTKSNMMRIRKLILRIMDRIFDEYNELLLPEYRDWTKKDVLCASCFKQFMQDHTWMFLIERKRKSGCRIRPDCRLGYNCDAQKHKAHAEAFNHLCEPFTFQEEPKVDLYY